METLQKDTSHTDIKDSKILVDYLLYLADNNLILAQRNAEWCGHGPVLEHDIAITNITLDLIGQARLFYQLAAKLLNEDSNNNYSEDSLAYLRTEREFKNCLLLELQKGDWGFTILRQYIFSTFQYFLFDQLKLSQNKDLAAIAEKSIKEVKYHVRWSSEWVLRLGDGTGESRTRMISSLDDLWMYTGELFIPAEFESEEITSVNLEEIKVKWKEKVYSLLKEATLPVPNENMFMQTGGKSGIHTEHLGFMLAEMQYLQRTFPNCEW